MEIRITKEIINNLQLPVTDEQVDTFFVSKYLWYL